MLTDDEANEMLESNDWAKFSDARELLKKAAYVGAMKEREMHAAGIELLRTEMASLLSMPRLMHACDAVGVTPNGENCDRLRRALRGA